MANHIKNNTNAIHHDTTEIKRDTEAILEEIQRLRIQLPNDRPLDEKRIQLEAWLDDLTQHAATVADGEVVDNVDDANDVDTCILARNRQNSEATLIVQPGISTPSIQTTLAGGYYAKHPTELSSATSHLIASLPCASRLIGIDSNAERGICASIHDDGVMRIWSMQTKRLSKELKSNFLISSTVWIAICPANPDILIVYDYRKASKPGKLNIEAWNWVKDRKIHIIINTKFTPETGYFFIPFSHIVYTRTTTNDLIIIDLNMSSEESSTGQSVSLSNLAISVCQDATSNRGKLFRFSFISDKELALIWRRARRRGLLRGSAESDYHFEVARLSSITPEDGQKEPMISERYSPSIISHARVISKFRLPSEARLVDMKVVPEKRIVLIFATRKSQGSSSASRVVYAMKLETGEELFSYDCPIDWTSTPAINSCVGFKDHDFHFHGFSLTDGNELAEFDIVGTILFETTSYIVSALRMQSGIGFWKTQKPQALRGSY